MFVKLLSIILTSLAPCTCNRPPIISPASFLWLIAHVRPLPCRDILLAQCQAATMSDVFSNLTCLQMPILGHVTSPCWASSSPSNDHSPRPTDPLALGSLTCEEGTARERSKMRNYFHVFLMPCEAVVAVRTLW